MANTITLSLVLLSLAFPALAQTPPNFDAPATHDVAVKKVSDGLAITFQPVEWPNAQWTAGDGKAWNWSKTSALTFDVTNPQKSPVAFSVRIDDDVSADGKAHCRTLSGAIGAGETGHFLAALDADDPMTHGMRGGPPVSSALGLTAMLGGGAIDVSHIVAWQIFLHSPAAPRVLVVKNVRLLPSLSSNSSTRYDGIYDGIVDTFGQFAKADWPGKIHNIKDFSGRRMTEDKSLAASPTLPGLDAFGGWMSGPQFPASGFFATAKRGGKWWLVTPSGHAFFSLGVDVVSPDSRTIVQGREAMFTALPAPDSRFFSDAGTVLYGPNKDPKARAFDFYQANLERKYGKNIDENWKKTTLKRLRNWGFNTVGNWSDEGMAAAGKMPYTATLGVEGNHARVASGSDYWGKMHDPFDPQFAVDAENSFREKASKLKNDPNCLGYFVDNELSWGGGNGPDGGRYGLAYGALSEPKTSPAKREFLTSLQRKYQTIDKLNDAWKRH